jgi:hypothetical protein
MLLEGRSTPAFILQIMCPRRAIAADFANQRRSAPSSWSWAE